MPYLRPFIFVLLCFGTYISQAQSRFGNEWINYNQSYYKISVGQTGIYRLIVSDLQKVGFPLSTVDATTVQLFFRGQEQAIFVAGEADKKIDNQDFIEFYGQRNDGTLDSSLYVPQSAQPHSVYNLYSDTTAYFLTWRLDGQAGKRMAFYQDANTNNLAPESYHRENLLLLNIAPRNYAGMSDGQIYPLGAAEGSQLSTYDVGEGWSGEELTKNNLKTTELSLENVVSAGEKPELEVHLMGRDHHLHRVEVMAGATANRTRTIETANFDFFYPYLSKKTLEFSDINTNKLYVSTVSRGVEVGQSDDAYSVSYYRLRYNQKFDFLAKNDKSFFLNPNATSRSYIEVPNSPSDTRVFDLTDPNNIIRIGTTNDNTTLKGVVRDTKTTRILYLNRTPLPAPIIEKITFRNIDPTKHNYLIVTHKTLTAPVQVYAAYRASVVGGRYDTLMITTDQLVNQFNYGEFSPLAIRRFAQFMANRGTPRFMFLIGKTQQVSFNRSEPNRKNIDMVPTFGWPGSDNMFSAGLKAAPANVPAFAVGRLWTDNPQTVLDYLDKVKQHENTPPNSLWRKNILHLSGGITPTEVNVFKRYTDDFKAKAQRQFLGANVTTITKKTDEIEYLGLSSELNKGVSLVTMFGHSGLSVTDIDIGFAGNDVFGYRNKGRYPLVYANGCVLGNFTFGEITYPIDWITAKDRGAILFLAHSNTAFTYSLKQYGDVFYDTYFNDSTNLSKLFGDVQRAIIQRFLKENPNSPIHIADAQQLALQGDPAVIMFPIKQPDYSIGSQFVSITAKAGGSPTMLSDSLDIRLTVSNSGLFKNEKVPVKIIRTNRDGSTQTYTATLPWVAYQDSIKVRIPNDRSQNGLNKFEVLIDPANILPEISEQNNTTSIELNIPNIGAYPLMPAEYAIVSPVDGIVNLIAQQVENITQNYVLELDTTALFNSAYKRALTTSAAQLPTWKVSLLTRDSTTYYWRVRYADRPANDDNRWAESSFTYIRNTTDGWVQRQPTQFTKTNPLQVSLSTTTQPTWTYTKTSASIKAVLTGNSVGAFNEGFSKTQLTIGDILLVTNGGCATYDASNNWRRDANVIVVALHRDNMRAYSVLPNQTCGNPPYVANTLADRLIINQKLLDKWLDAVPAGDWVVFMTSGNVQFDSWPLATKTKLKEFGVSDARLAELRSGRPYLFIGQKGAKSLAKELLTDPEDLAPSLRTLSLNDFVWQSTQGSAQITSSLIGPASAWGAFSNKQNKVNGQKMSFDVLGIDLAGNQKVIVEKQSTNALNLNQIDAKKYPYLRLQAQVENTDVSVIDPAQLRQWLVSYTPVAEGSAFSNAAAAVEKQEGEEVLINVGFKNVSSVAFTDSIVVRQTLYLANGQTQNIDRKLKKLAPNEESIFAVAIPTLGRGGSNRLVVNFNPRLQPEQTFANNVVSVPINVVADRVAPILEVAFDGQRIREGEVVSANPVILGILKDENRYLFKRDTVGIDVFLQRPNQSLRRVAFNGSVLKFTPADAQNVARIEYRPGALPDGIYTLRIQGADASGNRSGVYSISFRVINEPKVFEVTAFPNPFENTLKFSFILSGKDNSNEANILIMNTLGQIVKNISQPVHIGTNEWLIPNTQELAAGTYSYQLTVKNNNQVLPTDAATTTTGKIIKIR